MTQLQQKKKNPIKCKNIKLIVVVVLLMFAELQIATAEQATSLNKVFGNIWGNLKEHWFHSLESAQLEQTVEDWNAHWVASASNPTEANSCRQLICLPLDERFDPPMGVFSHGHVQTGDKCSLPRIFWHAIQSSKAEVPWLVQITKVKQQQEQEQDEETVVVQKDEITSPLVPDKVVESIVAGPLDFRSPSNYCFLPHWIMRALRLKPRDIVTVRLITTVPPGRMARFRPHSPEFGKNIANPSAVLETELRHYSSLVRGTTIAMDYNGVRYWFDVVDLQSSPRGERVDMIKAQDCDISTDFLRPKQQSKKKK